MKNIAKVKIGIVAASRDCFPDTLVIVEKHVRRSSGGEDFASPTAKYFYDSIKAVGQGRAARLGERSLGHLDAGATSCWIILKTMSTSLTKQIMV